MSDAASFYADQAARSPSSATSQPGAGTADASSTSSATSPKSPGTAASVALHSFYDLPPNTPGAAVSPTSQASKTAVSPTSASSAVSPVSNPFADSSPGDSDDAVTSPAPPGGANPTATPGESPDSSTAGPTAAAASSTVSPASLLSPEQQRVKEVMDKFAEWHTDLTKSASRQLIKEGNLHRQATFKSVDRTVFLFNDWYALTHIRLTYHCLEHRHSSLTFHPPLCVWQFPHH